MIQLFLVCSVLQKVPKEKESNKKGWNYLIFAAPKKKMFSARNSEFLAGVMVKTFF